MPFVLNGSPLIFSPCFVFLLFFFFFFFRDCGSFSKREVYLGCRQLILRPLEIIREYFALFSCNISRALIDEDFTINKP